METFSFFYNHKIAVENGEITVSDKHQQEAFKDPNSFHFYLDHYRRTIAKYKNLDLKYLDRPQSMLLRENFDNYLYYQALNLKKNQIFKDTSKQQEIIDEVQSFKNLANQLKNNIDANFKEPGKNIFKLPDAQVNSIEDLIGFTNGTRLYWVWCGGLLMSIAQVLPNNFHHISNLKNINNQISKVTGNLSWILYFLRLSLEMGMLVRHTIAGPWMDEYLKDKFSTYQRLRMQWQERYSVILNDLFWGVTNTLCMFLLKGRGLKATSGDLLTSVFLGLDLTLLVCAYKFDKADYDKQMCELDSKIMGMEEFIYTWNSVLKTTNDKELKAFIKENIKNYADENFKSFSKIFKIEELADTSQVSDKVASYLKVLSLKIAQLRETKKLTMHEWQYEKKHHTNAIVSTIMGIPAFLTLATPFMHLNSHLISILGVTGFGVFFAIGVVSAIVAHLIDNSKLNCEIAEIKENIKALREAPVQEGVVENDLNLAQTQLIDLQYQKRYNNLNNARNIIMQVIFPPIVFAATAFAPFGIGIAVLAATIIIGLVIKYLIDKKFKPENIKNDDDNAGLIPHPGN